ncbi:MAG: hypothetical protein WCO55_05100 [Candidatus Falkowbacteria bacterium]
MSREETIIAPEDGSKVEKKGEQAPVNPEELSDQKLDDIKKDLKISGQAEKVLEKFEKTKEMVKDLETSADKAGLPNMDARDMEAFKALKSKVDTMKGKIAKEEKGYLLGEKAPLFEGKDVDPELVDDLEDESDPYDEDLEEGIDAAELEMMQKEFRKQYIEKRKKFVLESLEKHKFPEGKDVVNGEKANKLAGVKMKNALENSEAIKKFIETGDNGKGGALFDIDTEFYLDYLPSDEKDSKGKDKEMCVVNVKVKVEAVEESTVRWRPIEEE